MDNIVISRNLLPLEESFFGSNKIHYRHKYYLAFCFDSIEPVLQAGDAVMAREIGDIRWCTLEDAMSKIRPYNVEKRELLLHAQSILRNYSFWFSCQQGFEVTSAESHSLPRVEDGQPRTNINSGDRGWGGT